MAHKNLKFGIQNGLNVARAGYTEDQILTACMLADKTGYDSILYMDHTNVPQWKNATVLDPWVMLSAIAAVTNNVELGTCVTDAIRRHTSNIALAASTLDIVSKGLAINREASSGEAPSRKTETLTRGSEIFGSEATVIVDLAYAPAIIITTANARVVLALDKAKSTIPVMTR